MLSLLIPALYLVPMALYLMDKRISVASLILVNIINSLISFLTNQLAFIPILIASLALTLTLEPFDLAGFTALSIGFLVFPIKYSILLIMVFYALSLGMRRKHGRFTVYFIIILVLYMLSKYIKGFASIDSESILLVSLCFLYPIHKIAKDFYESEYYSLIILSTAILNVISELIKKHFLLASIVSFLMISLGIFLAMKTRYISEFLYSLHLFTIGFLISVIMVEMDPYITYCLLVAHIAIILTMTAVRRMISSDELFKASELVFPKILELSTFIALISYFIVVSTISEILLEHGIHEIEFLGIGIFSVFASALSLAFFFRVFTIISISSSEKEVKIGYLDKLFVTFGFIALGFICYVILVYLSMTSLMLLIIFASAFVLSFIASTIINFRTTEPWFLGYLKSNDIKYYGEITQWTIVFSKVYKIRIPDEKISDVLNKASFLISFIPMILYLISEVIILV